MKSDLTIIISTFNEESNINDCLENVLSFEKNVLVVDSGSTDQTVQLVKNTEAKLVSINPIQFVEEARQTSIEMAETDWIFILDADERMTNELAQEVKNIISNFKARLASKRVQNSNFQTSKSNIRQLTTTYYKVPRKNIFGRKKWLKHGGWWPDKQIRLIYKPALISWPKQIHSTPTFKGLEGELHNPIIHYFHGDIKSMVNKTILFEDIESDLLFKANKKSGTLIFFRKFLGELFRRLVKQGGFLDGTIGIIESIYQAYSKTITYIFLYEKQQQVGEKKKSSTV